MFIFVNIVKEIKMVVDDKKNKKRSESLSLNRKRDKLDKEVRGITIRELMREARERGKLEGRTDAFEWMLNKLLRGNEGK